MKVFRYSENEARNNLEEAKKTLSEIRDNLTGGEEAAIAEVNYWSDVLQTICDQVRF